MVPEHNGEVGVEARSRAWTRRVGFGLIAVVVLFALIVPWVAPDPTEIDFELLRAAAPSWEHPAGTDALGRDNLARLAEGTAVSVGVGTLTGAAALFALFGIGAALGFAVHGPRRHVIAGIAAGLVGVGAIAVFAASLPTFRDLWAIYLLVLRDALVLILVFAAFGMTAAFRVTRDRQSLGASLRHVVFAVFPWAMAISVVVIVYESQLSFLGLGVSPPQRTLGSQLHEYRDGVLSFSGPWWLYWPALALLAAMAIGIVLIAISTPRPNDSRASSPRGRRVRVATAVACGAVLAFMAIQAAGDISWPSFDVSDSPQPQRVNTSGPEIENEPFEPPQDVIPSLVAAEPVICRSDEAVVQMRNVRAYDGGWTFDLAATTRRDQTSVIDDQDVDFGGDDDSRSLADNVLRFRLIYPDGREVDNVEGRYAHKNLGAGEDISLDWSDAGGDDGTYVWAYSVKPLPPQGTIQIDCAWPSLGAREERTSLSASALRAASNRAVHLW